MTTIHSRGWDRALLAGGLYFLLATATIALTANGTGIAVFWPANAALLALLLIDDKPRWTSVLVAGLVANLAANLMTRGDLLEHFRISRTHSQSSRGSCGIPRG